MIAVTTMLALLAVGVGLMRVGRRRSDIAAVGFLFAGAALAAVVWA